MHWLCVTILHSCNLFFKLPTGVITDLCTLFVLLTNWSPLTVLFCDILFSFKWSDNLNTLVMDKLIYLLVAFIWIWSKFIPVLNDDKKVLISYCLDSGQLSLPWPLFPHLKHIPGLYFPGSFSTERSILYGVILGRICVFSDLKNARLISF
jgi:hypothetical protein